MNHDDEHIREALALDALGALDGETRDTLAEHVAACAPCARERAELVGLTALLAHAAAPAPPPAELRARLLERVHELGPPSHGEAWRPSERDAAGASVRPDAARVPRPPPLSFTRKGPPAWAYGALAASALLAALVFLAWRENSSLRRELAAAAEESRASRVALERELQESRRGREESERQLAELLTAPGAGLARLAGTKDAPDARAGFAYDRASGRALLVASGLPAPPEGKAYQLWYFEGETPLPGPVFRSDAQGRATLGDTIPADWRGARAFAVTLEPASGVRAPTGSVYLAGPAS